MALIDSHGRQIKYLRLSVTDRCNLRCQYCMPAEGVPQLSRDETLSYQALYRIARELVGLGVDKIRLTGGEPLMRKGIVAFADCVAALPGMRELVLTTNGLMLGDLAGPLRRAGVQRLNVSLDSLKRETFRQIARGGDLDKVLNGLDAALAAGFPAPKINVVVLRGINDGELLDFAQFAIDRSCSVRFIEYMPTRGVQDWRALAVTGSEILSRVRDAYTLVPVAQGAPSEAARTFRVEGTNASIGIISPVTQHFCGSCDRIRITASGVAQTCLFGGAGLDLKPYLLGSDEDLREVLGRAVLAKPERHRLLVDAPASGWMAMSQIGG
jgi:GTP 3',8-cyclase